MTSFPPEIILLSSACATHVQVNGDYPPCSSFKIYAQPSKQKVKMASWVLIGVNYLHLSAAWNLKKI